MSQDTGWDAAMFARFRRAKGVLRRLLASRLLQANDALIKTLVGQLLGRQERRFNRLGKVYDAERLEWDDALQAGRIGFARALETYDPEKCKIGAYARWWIRYELQKQTPKAATICTPLRKEDQRPDVALVDKARLESLAGVDFGGLAVVDGLTPAMLQEWDHSNEWPETLEQAVGRVVVAVPVEPPITPWNAFLRDVVRLVRRGRTPRALLHGVYVRHARARGVVRVLSPSELGRELGVTEGVKDVARTWLGERSRVRAYKGAELRGYTNMVTLGLGA